MSDMNRWSAPPGEVSPSLRRFFMVTVVLLKARSLAARCAWHSVRTCLIVKGGDSWQCSHIGGGSCAIMKLWVILLWPILRRARILSHCLLEHVEFGSGERESVISRSLFDCSDVSCHCCSHLSLVIFLMCARRSPLRTGTAMTVGRFVASFAALSATSLPVIPTWLGTQHRLTFLSFSNRAFWMDITSGFFENGRMIAWIELFESVIITDSRGQFLLLETARRIAQSSAENIEVIRRNLRESVAVIRFC